MAEKPETSDELLSLKAAADLLRVSRATIYEMMSRGELAPANPDNPALLIQRRRFRRADIERLMREGRKPPTPKAD